MKKCVWITLCVIVGTLLPQLVKAQDSGDDISNLQKVLNRLYTEMLPMCSSLIGVGRGIAGFAATWYIAARVWRHLANAEPIDFYPLLRPFAIGIAVLLFPAVISVINGVMQPTVTGTAGMVQDSDAAIALLLQKKRRSYKANGCLANVCRCGWKR